MMASRKRQPDREAVASRTGLILLDSSLQLIAVDHGALSILADCRDGEGPGDNSLYSETVRLPKQILEVLRARSWTSVSGTCLIVSGLSTTYRCTLFRVEPQGGASDLPILALHFQRGASTDESIRHIANRCNLTDRELEVLRGLSTGMTSKEIATGLGISPNTVKSYIRLIMVKIGVTTRSGIVGKLLDHAATAGQ